MRHKPSKMLLLGFAALMIFVIGLFTVVDRTPYVETPFYAEMDERLDSLRKHLHINADTSQLKVGWSEVDITPKETQPLAGYGARDPKEMTAVHDSSYVRAVVFELGDRRVAMLFVDLLIIHPVIRNVVFASLPKGWQSDDVYFTATHTHSGQGGWAPNLAGEQIAGEYDADQVMLLAQAMVKAIKQAEKELKPGGVQFGELSLDDLVRNRLAKEKGIVDPWLKVARLQSDTLLGHLTVFSAHATCFGIDNRKLSSDYPGELVKQLNDPFDFAAFAAGAVGSMAANTSHQNPEENIQHMATELNHQVGLLNLIGMSDSPVKTLTSFRLPLPMREPRVKLSTNLAVSPYLFDVAFGEFANDVSVLVMGKAIFIGLPCDFSGELAVPLYQQARELGYQLFITSFNGGYAGYIIKDEWYDMKKFEARSMSWYGHDAGSYISEVVSRLIQIIHENDMTEAM